MSEHLLRATGRIAQIRVIMGNYWGGTILFRTQFDIDNNLHGKTYRNPTLDSMERLHKLLYEKAVPCFVDHLAGEIIFGDLTPLPDLFSWTAKKDRKERNGNG